MSPDEAAVATCDDGLAHTFRILDDGAINKVPCCGSDVHVVCDAEAADDDDVDMCEPCGREFLRIMGFSEDMYDFACEQTVIARAQNRRRKGVVD